jgi:hypothetical protein
LPILESPEIEDLCKSYLDLISALYKLFNDYSDRLLDGKAWTKIGAVLHMAYTLPHFMGYRFGLFNFATKTAGGSVDFDYYCISDEISVEQPRQGDPVPKGG